MFLFGLHRGRSRQPSFLWPLLIGVLLVVTKPAVAAHASNALSSLLVLLPNPQVDPAVCRAEQSTPSRRICDPDGILSETEKASIRGEITRLEEATGYARCPSAGVLHPQLGIALVRTMEAPAGTYAAAAARESAIHIHNEWGVGFQNPCGGTGVLLFVAVDDRQIYISRGAALRPLLSDEGLSLVIECMKPYLRDGRYSEALEVAVSMIADMLNGSPQQRTFESSAADDGEGSGYALEFFVLLGIFVFCWVGCCGHIERRRARREIRFKQELGKLDEEGIKVQAGKYYAASCPICLENFCHKEAHNNSVGGGTANEETHLLGGSTAPCVDDLLGSDKKPLKTLPCGHCYCGSCWRDFSRHPGTGQQSTRGGKLCPICRRPTDEKQSCRNGAGRENSALWSSQAYCQEERQFRIQRLRQMYPEYSSFFGVWCDPSFSGSLSQNFSAYKASGGHTQYYSHTPI